MANFRIEVNTYGWSCDCCGSGNHWRITLVDCFCGTESVLWVASYNDQFGGVLSDGDELLERRLYDEDQVKDFAQGMKKALEVLGHKVELVEYDEPCVQEVVGQDEYEEWPYDYKDC